MYKSNIHFSDFAINWLTLTMMQKHEKKIDTNNLIHIPYEQKYITNNSNSWKYVKIVKNSAQIEIDLIRCRAIKVNVLFQMKL